MADDLALFGHNLFGDPIKPKATGPVAARFTFPPFTVLDARAGEWQDRKRAWASMGIAGEVGRDDELLMNGAADWQRMNSAEGRDSELLGYSKTITDTGLGNVSIFDPVLCELIYRWFCPPKGQIVDPFAGGSVRGIVAGALGRHYWGSDLRPEQIAANEKQAIDIDPEPRPAWVCGDSRYTLATSPLADLIFSCPPYGDLERYSDLDADLSTYDWTGFSIAYRLILARAVERLKDNRFAAFVVGNYRDTKTGWYRDLVAETVYAMEQSGLGYYNEAVLVTSVGSASMRVTKQFVASRKLCKTHQNVLVFIKGDAKKAVEACGGI